MSGMLCKPGYECDEQELKCVAKCKYSVYFILPVRNLKSYTTEVEKVFLCLDLKNLKLKLSLLDVLLNPHLQVYYVVHFL
jgi:hypothetical protein